MLPVMEAIESHAISRIIRIAAPIDIQMRLSCLRRLFIIRNFVVIETRKGGLLFSYDESCFFGEHGCKSGDGIGVLKFGIGGIERFGRILRHDAEIEP